MIRMNEREYAKLNIKRARKEKPNPQYPSVRSIKVELELDPITIKFTIPHSLPTVNKLNGGNSKGNYFIRKKLQDEWLSFTAAYLKAAGYNKTHHLINCACEVRSYYSHHQVETQNLHTKGIWDALIGRIFDDDGPQYIISELKSSRKCKKGEERTDITIIGTEDTNELHSTNTS